MSNQITHGPGGVLLGGILELADTFGRQMAALGIAEPAVDSVFIQVAALSNLEKAQSVSTVLSALYQVPTQIPLINNIYKLRLGPLKDRFQAKMLLDELKSNGYPNAYTVEAQL